jgi:hypothetical protein
MASSRKASAELFLKLACSDVARAYRDLTVPNFRHHNVWFPSDAEILEAGMEENLRQHPQKTIEIDKDAVLTVTRADRGSARSD